MPPACMHCQIDMLSENWSPGLTISKGIFLIKNH